MYRTAMLLTHPAIGRPAFGMLPTTLTSALVALLTGACASPAASGAAHASWPAGQLGRASAAAAQASPQPFARAPVARRIGARTPADTADGSRYRVICHFPCGAPITHGALRVAEATWPFAERVFGDGAAAADLLEIHLYRTADDYRRARGGFLRPAPRHLAATDPASRTAHIALHGSIADTTLQRFGLPHNMLRIVAHEAFHLAALAHSPRSPLLPAWFNEGAASWAEHEALRATGLAAESEHEPVASTYLWLLQRRAQAGTLPRVGDVLRDELRTLDEQERYALRKLLFEQVLARDAGEPLAAVLRDVLDSAGRFTRSGRIAEQLHARLFGSAQRLDAVQHDMRSALAAAAPRWAQAARSLDPLADGALLQIGLTGAAEAWRVRFAGSTRLSGRLEPLTRGEARLLIGTNEEGSLIISFDLDADELVIRRHGSGDDAAVLARAPIDARGDAAIAFDVVALPGRITARAGEASLAVDVDDATPNGQWGVGVSAGANVVWHGLPH